MNSDQKETHLTSWNRLRAGDNYALGELYDGYIQILYKFGRRLCNDEELLTDAIHDVFEDIWKYRASLSEVEANNIQFYLCKSLKTKLLKYLNRQSRHTQLSEFEEISDDYIESVDTWFVNQETESLQKHQLEKHIAQLPKRQQEALLLRFYDNLSYDEIAEMMSLTRHSVYNLIYKALGQLRDNWIFVAVFGVLKFFYKFF